MSSSFFRPDQALLGWPALQYYTAKACRSRGGREGMAIPDFGESVNTISTRGNRICPPHCYFPEIFRPSYGPAAALIPPLFLWEKQLLMSAIERYNSQGELDDKVKLSDV